VQGHCYRSSTGKCERWYKPAWLEPGRLPSARADLGAIHDSLVAAVVKRLMSDAPLGVLLSGGLDSSLVASIAVRCAPARPVYNVVCGRNALPVCAAVHFVGYLSVGACRWLRHAHCADGCWDDRCLQSRSVFSRRRCNVSARLQATCPLAEARTACERAGT